jgi:hypothetical protein
MARASIWLAKFNREDDFVAQRPMLVNGVPVRPGDLIDKTKFTTRRLRCLFEIRKIRPIELAELPNIIETHFVSFKATPGELVSVPQPKKRGRPKRIAV